MIEWLEGKEKNVRALLCTLSAVLWEGVRWEQISMADVMTVKQVKQQYRKAARAVHPDKVSFCRESFHRVGQLALSSRHCTLEASAFVPGWQARFDAL